MPIISDPSCIVVPEIPFFLSKHAGVSQTLDCSFLCPIQEIRKQPGGKKVAKIGINLMQSVVSRFLPPQILPLLDAFQCYKRLNFLYFIQVFLYSLSGRLILISATISLQIKKVPPSFYFVFIITLLCS